MEFVTDNLIKTVAFYRCPDDIKHFKIRIKILELSLKKNKENIDKYMEKEFSWQEKIFSKTQKAYYKNERNCTTELEMEYHKHLLQGDKSQNGDDGFLFSYVDGEDFCPENEMNDKINYLQNAIDNLGLACSNKDNEYNFMASLQKSMENPLFKSNVENMFIMADFGEYFNDTWIKNERVLCSIRFYPDLKALSVFPDFTIAQPYTIKIQNDEEKTFGYFIEHSSKKIPEPIEVNEKTLIKKINEYRSSLKNELLTDTFKLTPKNKLYVFLFLEINSGKKFEYPDVYVQYFIDLPENWYTPNPERLTGRTQLCRQVRKNEAVVHFGYCVEVLLEYNFLELQKVEFPKSPYIYFEVVSKDSWNRHRTEGLCYQCLPVSSSGTFRYNLNCFRFTKNIVSELRRFFIGDCQNYSDVTWIGIPKDHEDSVLNKFGTKTIGTGELGFKLNIVHQSQSVLEQCEDSDDKSVPGRQMIFEKQGASPLIKSVEQVIREFKKARKQMLEARKNI